MRRRNLPWAILTVVVLVASVGCAGKQGPEPAGSPGPPGSGGSAAAAPPAPHPAAAPSAAPPLPAPEPAGSQALAEGLVGTPLNRDKTTRLVMSITTLVDRTTGLAGFRRTVAGAGVPLAERLSRLGATESGTEVTLRLPGSVLFDFDSAAIRPDAERTLADVVEVLQAYAGRPVRIEGHTDSIASEAYNQKLSERRAAAVRDWLVAHGVAAGRLKSVGYGESKPLADNGTAAGRQRNRRVEVVIEKAE